MSIKPLSLKTKRFLVGLFTMVLSGWLGVDAPKMKESVILLFRALFYDTSDLTIYYSSLFFCVALIFWILIFTSFITTENEQNQKRFEETLGAIHRAPNPAVFNEYPNFFDSIQSHLNSALKINPQTDAKTLNETLSNILRNTLELTQFFSTPEINLTGANVMVYFPTSEYPEFVEKCVKRKKIRFSGGKDVSSYAGILLAVPASVVLYTKKSQRSIPNLGLPVFYKSNINGEKYQMGGASYAIFEGNYSSSNVKELIESCEFLGLQVVSELEEYFNNEGKDVKSFASFRIGNNNNPIGVLNIDSGEQNLLGSAKEYHSTFTTLIFPVVSAIVPIVERIRDIVREDMLNEIDT